MRQLTTILAVIAAASLTAAGQDPVKVDPKHTKVELENDQIRVLRFHLGPHEISPMHEHPARAFVFVTDAHFKVTLGDGTVNERTGKAGEVRYRPAEKHAIENLSDKDYESVIVELKGSRGD
jgi:quercetin dioxygenase-like cupin family protein